MGADGDRKQPPSVADLLAEITSHGAVVPVNEPEPPAPTDGTGLSENERALEFEELRAFKFHHEGKKRWSYFMMFILGSLIIFQMFLLYKVGSGHWDFTKYEWLLPVLLVQNLAQVIGLAHVVVRSLFDGFRK